MAVPKHVVFDFDGTMADTMGVIIRIANLMAVERGWQPLSETEIASVRKLTAREALRRFRIPLWQLPKIMGEGRRRLMEHVDEIKLFDGIADVVTTLHDQGHPLYVLSANDPLLIGHVLQKEGLGGMFRQVLQAPLFQKHRSLKRLIRQEHMDRNKLWVIGDEVRDVNAANRVRANSIAVMWGFQDPAVWQRLQPTVTADVPQDILAALSK